MVKLNQRAKEYMEKFGWQHILLTVEEITTAGYVWENSELGYVYYLQEEIYFSDQAEIRYVEYPWITCFEVEGIEFKK